MRLVVKSLGSEQPVSQLHFGGGSPTFLSDPELQRVVGSLRSAFRLNADIEMSIEVDPRTVTSARLANLRELGFNRLSFGVQDSDHDVQLAAPVQLPGCARPDPQRSGARLSIDQRRPDHVCLARHRRVLRAVQQIGECEARPHRVRNAYALAGAPRRSAASAEQRLGSAQRVAMLGGDAGFRAAATATSVPPRWPKTLSVAKRQVARIANSRATARSRTAI
jgi:oxygen-independent coproporphyrinogen-3 oxidase